MTLNLLNSLKFIEQGSNFILEDRLKVLKLFFLLDNPLHLVMTKSPEILFKEIRFVL